MTEQPIMKQEQTTSVWSIVSLIGGIANFVGFPFWGAVIALVTGYIAKSEIEKSHGSVGGERLAQAGLILGWVGIGLGVLTIFLSILVVLGLIGGIAACGPLSEFINSIIH